MRTRAAIVSAMVFVVATTAGRAAFADDDEEARAAMRRGVAAFGRGEAEKALEEYELAKKLVPQANAPYLYAAEALVALARYEEAVANLERYLAKNPGVSDADDVRGRIAKIKAEHYPGHVKITVNADDATIFLDGESKGTVRELDAKPGAHRIEARAAGREPVTQEITVVGAQDTTVVLTLAEARIEPPPPPPSIVVNDTGVPWKTIGWVTTGVGATTFLVALIVDAAALGPKITDYREAASRGDPSARALHDDAVGLRTLSVAGYVAGGVLTAAGVGMVLFAPKPAPATTPSAASLGPWFTVGGGGIGLRCAL